MASDMTRSEWAASSSVSYVIIITVRHATLFAEETRVSNVKWLLHSDGCLLPSKLAVEDSLVAEQH